MGSNRLATKRFLAFAKNYEGNITKEGLKFIELDAYNVLLWESITAVKQKLPLPQLTFLFLKILANFNFRLCKWYAEENLT